MAKVHLAKVLKERGNYTKSEIKLLIKENRVLVNNEKQPLSYIVSDNDIIQVDGKVLEKVPYVYYLYHKPKGVICTNNLGIKDNIIEKLNVPYRIFCVGRLDKDTSGLIILTNDGAFCNDIINSGSDIEKEYIVKVKYPINNEFIINITKPIMLRGKLTKEAKVEQIDKYSFKIILTEGKYHQIRRLVIYNKNTVVDLKRIRIGEYLLDDMKENEIIKIREDCYDKK